MNEWTTINNRSQCAFHLALVSVSICWWISLSRSMTEADRLDEPTDCSTLTAVSICSSAVSTSTSTYTHRTVALTFWSHSEKQEKYGAEKTARTATWPQHGWSGTTRIPLKLGWNRYGVILEHKNLQYLREGGKIGPRLLWRTNRKLHMRFRLAPKSMTLNSKTSPLQKWNSFSEPTRKS